jgi:hypothetical protein
VLREYTPWAVTPLGPDCRLRDEGRRGDIARSVYTHSAEAAADSTDYDEVEAIAEGRA